MLGYNCTDLFCPNIQCVASTIGNMLIPVSWSKCHMQAAAELQMLPNLNVKTAN